MGGRREGFGTLVFANGVFEGTGLNGLATGKGTVSFKNGDNFAGLFQNSRKSGYGFYHWADGALEEGEYVKGKKHGWHRWRRGRDGWDLHYAHGKVIEAWRNQVTEEELQEDQEAEIIADPVLEQTKADPVLEQMKAESV